MGKFKNMFTEEEENINMLMGFFGTNLIKKNVQYDTISEFECKLTEDMTFINIVRIKTMYEMAMDMITVQPLNGNAGDIFNIGKRLDLYRS